LDVLSLVADGKQNKEIAGLLNIKEHTVEQHLKAIFFRLVVCNRVEASMIFKNWQMQVDITHNGNPL
jgi:DNA-binding NarL/FixJ family response regulator